MSMIMQCQNVVFRTEGDMWVVEGFSLVFREPSGREVVIPVVIGGAKGIEIPNGGQVVGIRYTPKTIIDIGRSADAGKD